MLTKPFIELIKMSIRLLLWEGHVDKTEQTLAYILKTHPESPITSLMKLAYLIDYVSMTRFGESITNFDYKRYKFGPFNHKIYQYMENLKEQDIITDDSRWTQKGDEYIVYNFNDELEDPDFDLLTERDKDIIQEVVSSLSGYGAKALTEIAYNTPPMTAIGATMDGDENLNVKLDLCTK